MCKKRLASYRGLTVFARMAGMPRLAANYFHMDRLYGWQQVCSLQFPEYFATETEVRSCHFGNKGYTVKSGTSMAMAVFMKIFSKRISEGRTADVLRG